MKHALARHRERAYELHATGLGRAPGGGETALAQARQLGVVVVAREVDERREDVDGPVAVAVGIERLGCTSAQLEIVWTRLELRQHALDDFGPHGDRR